MSDWVDRFRQSSTWEYVSAGLGVVLLVGIGGLLYARQAQLARLVRVTPRWFVMLMGLQAGYFFCQSMAHQAVVRGLGVELSLGESYGLTLLNNAFNLFTPARGGALVRAGYMKSTHGIRVRDSVQGMAYMGCLGMGSLGVLGLGWITVAGGRSWVWTLFLSVGGLGLGAMMFPPLVRRLLHRWDRFDLDPRTWKRLSGPGVAGPVLLSYVGMAVLYGLRIHVAMLCIGYPVHWSVSALSGFIVMSVAALPVVPGSVGVQESLMGTVMGVMGVPVSVVLLGALMERLSQLLFLAVPSLVAYVRLIMPGEGPDSDRVSTRESEPQCDDSSQSFSKQGECPRWIS